MEGTWDWTNQMRVLINGIYSIYDYTCESEENDAYKYKRKA